MKLRKRGKGQLYAAVIGLGVALFAPVTFSAESGATVTDACAQDDTACCFEPYSICGDLIGYYWDASPKCFMTRDAATAEESPSQ